MKTRARISFIADLDEINRNRKLNGHEPWTVKDFFEIMSGRAVITVIDDKNRSETLEVNKLNYIVI